MVKVGDKVRVTTDRYLYSCPRGSIVVVTDIGADRGEAVSVNLEGSGFHGFLWDNDYELVPADKPDPRDDPSNPDKLPLREMSDRVIAMIVRADPAGREWMKLPPGKWVNLGCGGMYPGLAYRLRPRTVRIEYDCDEDGKPIMETGREVE